MQQTFNQRVLVYSVKLLDGIEWVEVRAQATTSIGKLSIFFELPVMGAIPTVNEEILVSITIPADSIPTEAS